VEKRASRADETRQEHNFLSDGRDHYLLTPDS